jgi:hypothetical protein
MTLRKAILTALDRCEGFLVPEMTVWTDANAIRGLPATLTEVREMLTSLEGRRHVVSVRDDDGAAKYRITANGKAALLSS